MYTVEIRVPEKQSNQIDAIKTAIQSALPSATVKAYIGHLSLIGIEPDPGPISRANVERVISSFRQ